MLDDLQKPMILHGQAKRGDRSAEEKEAQNVVSPMYHVPDSQTDHGDITRGLIILLVSVYVSGCCVFCRRICRLWRGVGSQGNREVGEGRYVGEALRYSNAQRKVCTYHMSL
jgi:hypothetical protein